VGRVAAASLAFSAPKDNNGAPPRPSIADKPTVPPVTTRVCLFIVLDTSTLFALYSHRGAPITGRIYALNPSSFFSTQKFGDVDTSSAKNLFGSLRNSTANKSATPSPPIAPSAFAPKKNAFAPPPARRVPPTTSGLPAKRQPETEEEEVEGEWAEALYDYSSEVPIIVPSFRIFTSHVLYLFSRILVILRYKPTSGYL
jgi:abl interactor 2